MSTCDPLGLLGEEAAPQSTSPKSAGSASGWLVAVLVVIAVLMAGNYLQERNFFRQDDQQHEQKQQKTAAKTLVFVHERNPSPIEHDLMLRRVEDAGWPYRSLDDDITDEPVPQLIAYAQTRGISPPFVVATDSADKPMRAIAWPSDFSQLEEFRGQ